MEETNVINRKAKYDRTSMLKFVGDKVIFDNSDGEYGVVEFSLKYLEEQIKKHKKKLMTTNKKSNLKFIYWDD